MSESQKPQANTPSTHESGTASPFAAAAAQGEQPGQAPGGEMSDVSYSMETVTVDPSTLNMLRGSGQSQAPSQQAPGQPQQAPGQPPQASAQQPQQVATPNWSFKSVKELAPEATASLILWSVIALQIHTYMAHL